VAWATPDGLELVGAGAAVALVAEGPERFDSLRAGAERAFDGVDHEGPPSTRPRMVGGFAFDEADPGGPWESFPAAGFVLPRVQLVRTDGATYLTVNGYGAAPGTVETALAETRETIADLPPMRPAGEPPGVTATRFAVSRADWIRGVERALERIRAGGLRKVVLATALEADLASAVDVAATLERFRRTYPSCFRVLVQPGERAFFGPPPERLARVRGRHVETEALAGSVPRGETPEADADLAASLVESDKIQHEQGVVVEAIRDQLAPLGEVCVGERSVRRLATIQHLRTPVSATLDSDTHVLRIVEALHPTPAVGGLPPGRAREVIRETEPFDRGWYAAPVGWFDAAGDGEFAVAIRSALARQRRATLFAGNGIVTDSDPEEEWAEIQHKFRPVLDELEHSSDG
jgi:menaquinone-specific isochorismate synthase